MSSGRPIGYRYWFFQWIGMDAAIDAPHGTDVVAFLVDDYHNGDFDLYTAHRHIEKTQKLRGVILHWREINRDQFDQYKDYVRDVDREKRMESDPTFRLKIRMDERKMRVVSFQPKDEPEPTKPA
jgi:hypothetical protein